MMTEAEVVKIMESSQTAAEWNDNCDTVKAAFDGNYPDFWYTAIIRSGLVKRVSAQFKEFE